VTLYGSIVPSAACTSGELPCPASNWGQTKVQPSVAKHIRICTCKVSVDLCYRSLFVQRLLAPKPTELQYKFIVPNLWQIVLYPSDSVEQIQICHESSEFPTLAVCVRANSRRSLQELREGLEEHTGRQTVTSHVDKEQGLIKLRARKEQNSRHLDRRG